MPVKVSVIVPVYNPGTYIEDCIASLQRQSLPPEAYEVIFVDDGSTDATPARLDALAAEDPRMRVIHQENSGWSGKPRNVGIDAARGEYVMFVDNDDYLGDETLERMYDYGVAHGADVVVGKMAGKGRPVPVELFRRNHPRATLADTPLIDSLTPHKMVRREFLDRIGLRFPEGRRRLEDHVFVTEAYLRAENVSVLSDYVCYYHVKRDDAANAGFQRFDPVGYFGNLREALDIVEKYTEPGALRDRLFRRWLRNEMVERLRGKRLLAAPEDYRRELFTEIHKVVVERFGPGVAAGLQPTQRVVAALTAADRFDDLVAFAEWEASVALSSAPETVTWRDGTLEIGFRTEYTCAGQPMTFPAGAASTPLDGAPKDVAEAIAWVEEQTAVRFEAATADLLLRERSSAAQHFQPVRFTREPVPAGDDGRVRLTLRATATVDPGTLPGTGIWDALVRVKLGGWTKECRLGPVPRPEGRLAPPAGVVAARAVLPYWTDPHRNLSLDLGASAKRLGVPRADLSVSGDRLGAGLPLYVPGETEVLVRLATPGRSVDVPGTLSPTPDPARSRLAAVLPAAVLAGGTWKAAVCLAPQADRPRFHALPRPLRVEGGEVRVGPPPRPGLGERLWRKARRMLGAAVRKTASRIAEARKART
ncbi:glycosyltransferase family 2 protein [Streptomyces sp. ISL-12]|uniref:glycosyltransferase family 2 protein n=1 Tax=Streptomyces sp. ISL-12 TaxID=2819177 RepID=UPI001BEA51AF|nr:glycosyltransferase family 2 protein [Streptomyces sp. ISL-12]MBT2411192.1 glycosyltransferase family 2 protein [Streptomyces sp. ISL-12]